MVISIKNLPKVFSIFFLTILFSNLLFSAKSFALTAAERRRFAENNILFYSPDEESPFLSDSSTCLVDLGDTAATVLNFLVGHNYSKNASAGIVGNLMAESGLKTNVLEGGKVVDSTYVLYDLSSDSSNYPNKGFGLGQWTTASRQKALQTFANNNGLTVTSLEAQLGYLITELSARGFSSESMSSDSLEESTFKIFDKFEVPGSSFWTTVNGTYYNDYDPTSLSELSAEKTPAAYKAFNRRLSFANSALKKIDNSNLTGSFASSCEDTETSGSASDPEKIRETGGDSSTPTTPSPESEPQVEQPEQSEQQPTQPESEHLTSSSSVANQIAQLAVSMAWPYSSGANAGYCKSSSGTLIKWNTKNKPSECSSSLKEENAAVLSSLYGNAKVSRAKDCSWFVADVIKYLKVDQSFPSGGSAGITNYLSKTSKWIEVQNLGNTSNLQPGDVFSINGHVMIYVGSYGGRYGNAVGASKDSWVARVHNIYYKQYSSGATFRIFRYKE